MTGFTHRWDATYGKLFYNHDTGAYIFKPDEDAIDPLSATVSQYTDIFVTDGIATTAGELGIKIIGMADAQGRAQSHVTSVLI